MDTVLKILLAIAVAVILVILLIYQNLDHNRSLAIFHLKRMKKPMRRWLEEGIGLFSYVKEEQGKADYLDLIDQFDHVSNRHTCASADLFNRAHDIIFRITADNYDEKDLTTFCEKMNELSLEIDCSEEYNHFVGVYNRKLDTRVSGLIGKVLHMERFCAIEDPTLIFGR